MVEGGVALAAAVDATLAVDAVVAVAAVALLVEPSRAVLAAGDLVMREWRSRVRKAACEGRAEVAQGGEEGKVKGFDGERKVAETGRKEDMARGRKASQHHSW